MTEETKKPEQALVPESKGVEKAIKEEQSLEQRIMGVMKDVIDTKLSALEKALDLKIDALLKAKEVEVEKALRKGFGLEQDPVVHMSDLIEHGRKLALEKADTGKRTPAPETPLGPEGNTQPTPIDEIFAKAKKGELA